MSRLYGFLGLYQFLNSAASLRLSLRFRRRLALLAVFLCSQTSFCNASLADISIDKIKVTEKDGVYYINASSEILASSQYVRQVLTDYIHIYRLNDSIIESRILTPVDSDKVHVHTLVQCCVPMYCKDVTRVEEVNELKPGVIQATIIPEKSDFRSGVATWTIKQNGDVTQLSYKAHLEPDFFIPPIIGTQLVIKNMHEEFRTTFFRIGRIAAINEAKEWDNNLQFTRIQKPIKTEPCDSLQC